METPALVSEPYRTAVRDIARTDVEDMYQCLREAPVRKRAVIVASFTRLSAPDVCQAD
jgi:hypothetical protein